MGDSSPPVISLRPLGEQRSSKAARRTVEQVEASLKKFGCVCLPVSDLDSADQDGDQLVRRCYSLAESFFTLPEVSINQAAKLTYTEENAARKGYGGSCYTPLGKEPAYQEGEKQHVESFSCTRPLAESLCGHVPGGPEYHKSLFPDSQVPGFGAAYSSLWEALRDRVALPMMDALEQMLCLPRDFLSAKSAETGSLNMSLLRTLRYPAGDAQQQRVNPQPENNPKRRRSTRKRVSSAPVDVGISEHTDFEVFTIMHQDSAGLHLCTPSRAPSPRWYQPPFRYDTLTVILGDMTELWTSGWLEATRHKVESPAYGYGPRKSFVLFQGHDDLVKVRPLSLADLAAREGGPESRAEEAQHVLNRQESRGEEGFGDERLGGPDSFAVWVQHRPKNARTKYRITTQGAWVRKQESQAKAVLIKAAQR